MLQLFLLKLVELFTVLNELFIIIYLFFFSFINVVTFKMIKFCRLLAFKILKRNVCEVKVLTNVDVGGEKLY